MSQAQRSSLRSKGFKHPVIHPRSGDLHRKNEDPPTTSGFENQQSLTLGAFKIIEA